MKPCKLQCSRFFFYPLACRLGALPLLPHLGMGKEYTFDTRTR